VNIGLNLLLMPSLAHVGLALATAIAALFNAGALLFMLWRSGNYAPLSGWLKFAAQLFIALAVMTVFLIWGTEDITYWLSAVWWERLLYLLGLVFGAVLIYFATLHFSGLPLRSLLKPRAVGV
jgi:putative peptidoglycan lipid II flippase